MVNYTIANMNISCHWLNGQMCKDNDCVERSRRHLNEAAENTALCGQHIVNALKNIRQNDTQINQTVV